MLESSQKVGSLYNSMLISPSCSPAGAAVATPLSDLLREVYDVASKKLTPQVTALLMC